MHLNCFYRVLLAEASNKELDLLMKYYGTEDEPIADFPFNFYLSNNLSSRKDVTGNHLKTLIDLWLKNMPKGKWPNWLVGNIKYSYVVQHKEVILTNL